MLECFPKVYFSLCDEIRRYKSPAECGLWYWTITSVAAHPKRAWDTGGCSQSALVQQLCFTCTGSCSQCRVCMWSCAGEDTVCGETKQQFQESRIVFCVDLALSCSSRGALVPDAGRMQQSVLLSYHLASQCTSIFRGWGTCGYPFHASLTCLWLDHSEGSSLSLLSPSHQLFWGHCAHFCVSAAVLSLEQPCLKSSHHVFQGSLKMWNTHEIGGAVQKLLFSPTEIPRVLWTLS